MEPGLNSGLLTLCSQLRHRCDLLIIRCLWAGKKSDTSSVWNSGCARRCVSVVTTRIKNKKSAIYRSTTEPGTSLYSGDWAS